MEIQVTGRHTALPTKLIKYAKESVEELIKYYHGITGANVVIDHQTKGMTVELVISVRGGGTLIAEVQGDDITTAIDMATKKLARQLKKHKGKLSSHRR